MAEREARLLDHGPLQPTLTTNYKVLACKPIDSDDIAKMDWDTNQWAGRYMLMTTGPETGKAYEIQSNTKSTITLVDNVAYERMRKSASFRIIYNENGTQCIPSGFLTRGDRIPSINGTSLEKLGRRLKRKDVTLEGDLSFANAQILSDKNYCRYSYAILLDGPESPDLFRAYVLVYKDFDSSIQPPRDWWKNKPPVEYYVFYYRRR